MRLVRKEKTHSKGRKVVGRTATFACILAIAAVSALGAAAFSFALETRSSAAVTVPAGATVFTAPVEAVSQDGTAATVDCRFAVLSSGMCAVYGNGQMSGTRAVDTSFAGSITIPETVRNGGENYTVTAVDTYAFGGAAGQCCSLLTTVTLPDSVTSIGSYAFANCAGLTMLTLPSRVATIDDYAFYGCSGITEVTVPQSVQTLGRYAFCQCNGLQKVRFECDADQIGEYAFTGQTRIGTVIYEGRAVPLDNAKKYFNGDSASLPTFYYTVKFYGSQADAEAGTAMIGKAVVSGEVKYKDLYSGAKGLLEGAVPEYPEGTNLWMFEGSPAQHLEISDSCYAYPVKSRYRDLMYGSADFPDCKYTGAPIDPTEVVYIQRQGRDMVVPPVLYVYDMNGTQLDFGINYTVSYQRRDGNGGWTDTTDLTNPGEVQITISGVAPYEGTLVKTFNITFEQGCTFVSDIPLENGSTSSTVSCAFKITSMEDGHGTVSVHAREATKKETAAGTFTRAIPVDTRGEITIPETIEVLGVTFDVTAIDDSAFGYTNAANPVSCQGITKVTVPKSVTRVGTRAFNMCSSLEEVVFEGDLDKATFGTGTFLECGSLDKVIFYGKRPNDSRYALSSIFSSGAHFYYTVTFYESRDASDSGAAPIGSATVSEDLMLADLPDMQGKPAGTDLIYSGEVPAYPSSLIDDTNNPSRHWYAPMWAYPDVDMDTSAALKSKLTDSVDAYAQQMQDAFAIDDAMVMGIDSSYKWTGSPVLDSSKVAVYSICGGKMKEDTDYTIEFQRMNDREEWEPTDDLVSGGDLRAVLNGAGAYASQTRSQVIEFRIVTSESSVGTHFTYNVKVTDTFGNVDYVPCEFTVTSIGSSRSCTVEPAQNSYYGAIGNAYARGNVEIPEYAECNGVPYRVTALGDNAFNNCTQMTSVTLPDSIESIGIATFYKCSSLERFNVPTCATSIGQSMFYGCSSLTTVTIPEGVTSIGNWGFYGCAKLCNVVLPSTLRSIETNAFYDCKSLGKLNIPVSLTSYSTAFRGSGVTELVFDEGITEIPASAFEQCSNLVSVKLPSTIDTIGTSAFSRTSIEVLELPEGLSTVGSMAFNSCSALSTVLFDGDPAVIEFGKSAFSGCGAISKIVYRQNAVRNASEIFPLFSSSTKEYSGVSFYASQGDYEMGEPLSTVYVEHGTPYRLMYAGKLSKDKIYDGTVPSLPDGTSMWVFNGGTPISREHDDKAYAIATMGDESDLSTGYVVTNGAYAYTGVTVDPFSDGTGTVITASGKSLARGTHYNLSFERQGTDGTWAPTGNRTSRGTVKVIATAIEGSGYTGQAVGYYSITEYMPGTIFTDTDSEGREITYLVLEGGNSVTPGKVAVGTGGSSGSNSQAVDQSATGALEIPELVHDPRGVSYQPTEISPYAFYRCMGITSVKIPSSVVYIGARAFAYESQKTDTKTSSISKIEFMNDLSKCTVARSAFLGCDVVKTVVYDRSKGNFEKVSPLSNKPGVTTTRYCTARYYSSIDSLRAGEEPLAKVVLKEGSYLFSPSQSDYMAGSDKVPLAATGYSWVYDEDAQDSDGRVTDSQNVYAYEVPDNTIVANVDVSLGGATLEVPCVFSILSAPSDGKNGTVCVGRMSDGTTALAADTAGAVKVPATVSAAGSTYDVVEVGAFAFGSSEPDMACGSITGIELPSSVTSVEQAAFMNCTSLESVTISDSSKLVSIGAAAFSRCGKLANLDFPEGLEAIASSAFDGCALTRVDLPQTLKSLGKRAFNSNTALREVVFEGKMHLELPALGEGTADSEDEAAGCGSASAVVSGSDSTATGMRLSVIDDYVFAGCSSLERIVFEADASQLTVSTVAFEGSEAISTVVYGSGAAQMQLPVEAPAIYYTLSYFESADAMEDQNRLSYLVVPAGAVMDDFDSANAYAGSVPQLPDHYEWVSEFDSAEPLVDSQSIYMQKIAYAIDTSLVDPAFKVSVTVDGKAASTATFGDQVNVSVSSSTQVQPSGFKVVSAATGDLVYECDQLSGSFAMPGENVRISVGYEMNISIFVQKPKAVDPEEHVLTVEQVEAVSQGPVSPNASAGGGEPGDAETGDGAVGDGVAGNTSSNPLYFSTWDKYRESGVIRADEYVTLDDLLSLVGVNFDEGDSLVIESTKTGASFSISYSDIQQYERFYYPNVGRVDSDGGVRVDPVLAVRSATCNPLLQGIDDVQASMQDGYRFCIGQRERELLNIVDTDASCVSQVDKITVLCGAEPVENCTVSGLDQVFYYTGEQIAPEVTVADPDGTAMIEGVDYTVSYGENVEAGYGTVTITGLGAYTGTAEHSFKIRRAQSIAGQTRESTAAMIALEAYPHGSDGVIVASSRNYPDALSATALSGALGYPIVLTSPDSLSPEAESAISALSIGSEDFTVVVVGGTGAVSQSARDALLGYVYNENYIVPLAGNDRYATSNAVYAYGKSLGIWGQTAIVASGTGFADALSISPYAAAKRAPILLTDGNSLADSFVSAIENDGFSRAVVVGGTSAVGEGIESQLVDKLGGGSVTRLGGSDRYDTSSKVVEFELSEGMVCDGAAVATGENFPDALATGGLLATSDSVLLLVSPSNTTTLSALAAHANDVARIYIVGGEQAVPSDVRSEVVKMLSWSEEALS